MRIPLAVAASFAALALAGPAAATSAAAPDTAGGARVHGDARPAARWHCTPAGCAAAPASWSPALGFAATALAAVTLSRRRSPGRR
jgi:hypothetical protein